jgi:phosphoesterase RecJ-like protein
MIHDQIISDFLRLFQAGNTVAIVGHLNVDGDSVGSVLALDEFLKARGCQVTKLLAREKTLPNAFLFLADSGFDLNFLSAEEYPDTPDIFIAVDMPQAYRMDKAQSAFGRAAVTVLIDHHPNVDNFATMTIHDQTAAATGLLIWQIITASGQEITSAMATACYLALLTDTGRFSHQNTDAAVLAAAAEMAACGADPNALSLAIYETRRLGSLKLDGRLVERMEYLVKDKVVYSWVTEADFHELEVSLDDTEGLIAILRSLAGAELSILLREETLESGVRQVRVNLRSRGSYDTSKLASDHGGGGHQAAAGFNFAGTIAQTALAITHYLESEGLLTSDDPDKR